MKRPGIARNLVAIGIIVFSLSQIAFGQDEPGRGDLNINVDGPVGVGITICRNGNYAGSSGSDPRKGGLCTFANLVPGVYEMRVDRADANGVHYAPIQVFGITVTAGSRTNYAFSLVKGLTLQTTGKVRVSDLGTEPARGRLDLIVTDPNHLPRAAAIALFRNGNYAGSSGSDPNKGGLCTFPNLVPGVYEMRVDRADANGVHYAPLQVFGITVTAGSRTNYAFSQLEGLNLQIISRIRVSDLGTEPARGRLDFIVTDPNHLPSAAAIALFRNGNYAGSSGSDPRKGGLCTFANLVPGVYEMRVDRADANGVHYAPIQVFGITVTAGSRTNYAFSLVKGLTLQTTGKVRVSDLGTEPARGRLDLIVTDPNHLPRAAAIALFRNGNYAGSSGSDPNKGGLCTFANLLPGLYEVHIDKSEGNGRHFAKLRINTVEIAPGTFTSLAIGAIEGSDEMTLAPTTRLGQGVPNEPSQECVFDAGAANEPSNGCLFDVSADNSVDPVGPQEVADP